MPQNLQIDKKRDVHLGVSNVALDELPRGALWECSFKQRSEVLTSARVESLFAGFEFLNTTDPSELWDLHGLLVDSCRRFTSVACVVHAPLGWLMRLESRFSLESLITRWSREGTCPLYFDFGRGEAPSWVNSKMVVADPMWNRGRAQSDYWRVHGWRSERWVRMYSEADLLDLARKTKKQKPLAVVLAHSRRIHQWMKLDQLRNTI